MGPKFCKSRIYGNVISAQSPVKADLWNINIMGPKSCKSEIYETVIWGRIYEIYRGPKSCKSEIYERVTSVQSPVKAKFSKP